MFSKSTQKSWIIPLRRYVFMTFFLLKVSTWLHGDKMDLTHWAFGVPAKGCVNVVVTLIRNPENELCVEAGKQFNFLVDCLWITGSRNLLWMHPSRNLTTRLLSIFPYSINSSFLMRNMDIFFLMQTNHTKECKSSHSRTKDNTKFWNFLSSMTGTSIGRFPSLFLFIFQLKLYKE